MGGLVRERASRVKPGILLQRGAAELAEEARRRVGVKSSAFPPRPSRLRVEKALLLSHRLSPRENCWAFSYLRRDPEIREKRAAEDGTMVAGSDILASI